MATIRRRGKKFRAMVRRGQHSQSKTFSSKSDAEHWSKKLELDIERSVAWRCLPSNHIKVYLKLCRRYNGSNNGKTSLSKREDAKLLHIGDSAAQGVFKRLQEHGFIKVTRKDSFIGRRATEYALADKSLDGHQPTNEWRQWKQKKKQKWNIDTIREDALD